MNPVAERNFRQDAGTRAAESKFMKDEAKNNNNLVIYIFTYSSFNSSGHAVA
jgi:hypothetical protein